MKTIQLLIGIFILAGCATTPPLGEKSTLLKVGMAKSEVTEIFGAPKTTSVTKTADGAIEKWSYWTKKMVGYMMLDNPSMAGSGNRLL